jgi:hypothetical protein
MVEDVCKGCGSDAERPAIYGKLKLTYFECISGLIIGWLRASQVIKGAFRDSAAA